MNGWELANKCPNCGGRLTVSEHFSLSHDFKIRRDGQPCKRFRKSPEGAIDCVTVLCDDCLSYWDGDHATWDYDGIYIKGKGVQIT